MHLTSFALKTTLAVTIIALSLLFLMACKTIDFNPQTYTGDYITIGEGGGIAGIETSYHILPNGKTFKQSSIDTAHTQLPSLDKAAVQQALASYQNLALDEYSFEDPGNIYRFMSFQVEGKINRIVWHDEEKIRKECVQIYRILHGLIQKEKK